MAILRPSIILFWIFTKYGLIFVVEALNHSNYKGNQHKSATACLLRQLQDEESYKTVFWTTNTACMDFFASLKPFFFSFFSKKTYCIVFSCITILFRFYGLLVMVIMPGQLQKAIYGYFATLVK